MTSKRKQAYGNELLKLETSDEYKGIATFCQPLDNLLGDGIKPGIITEVVGLPGVGKTTFCLQLCLDVQIPKHLKGHDGESIYIGTDHSFSVKRLSEMASAFVTQCNKVTSGRTPPDGPLLLKDDVMSRIHIAKCCDAEELVQIIISLEKYLVKNLKVKLVVIDSIAFPMYTEGEDFSSRVKLLYGIGQLLYGMMNKLCIAVVLTNNMTTRFGNENGFEYYVPFLGDGWSYVPNQRIQFSLTPGNPARKAELLKSTYCTVGSTPYRIVSAGFRE